MCNRNWLNRYAPFLKSTFKAFQTQFVKDAPYITG